MNRKIKFRAWFKDIGMKYHYNPYESCDALMQFTGLLDKNGKEIYEGDVLKNSLEESRISVRWDITGASWNFDELDCELDDGVGRGNWYFTMGVAKECEVIGNIYENPNLTINENT